MPDAAQRGNATGHAIARLADLKNRSAERQLLSIYDDRIQTEQQLAKVYGKWSAQVLLQHRIVVAPDSAVRLLDCLHPDLHGPRRCAGTAADGYPSAGPTGRGRRCAPFCSWASGAWRACSSCWSSSARRSRCRPFLAWPPPHHHRIAGLHSGVFRLVCSDGQERHSRRRSGSRSTAWAAKSPRSA